MHVPFSTPFSGRREITLHGSCHQMRVTHVGAVPRHIQHLQRAAFWLLVQVLSYGRGHQRVVAVLQNQAGSSHEWQFRAVVREEGGLSKDAGHHRISRAETFREFAAQAVPLWLTRHHGREVTGPAHVVLIHEVQQAFQILALKATLIVWQMIDKAWRGSDQYHALKEFRSLNGCQQANAGADRMTYKMHPALEAQYIAHIQHILHITLQASVLHGVKGSGV